MHVDHNFLAILIQRLPERIHIQLFLLSETQYNWSSMNDMLKFLSELSNIAKVAPCLMHSLCALNQVL